MSFEEKKIEIISWRDSMSLGGWQFEDHMLEWGGNVIQSIGYVVSENETDVVLAMSGANTSQGSTFCNWLSIPKTAIILREKI